MSGLGELNDVEELDRLGRSAGPVSDGDPDGAVLATALRLPDGPEADADVPGVDRAGAPAELSRARDAVDKPAFAERDPEPSPPFTPTPHLPESGIPLNAPRRGAADPVKVLMHRHRELCERAVDPLEIAAGLEAHGVTDRTAARFRHRDVFSLAEEMYARIPRDSDPASRPASAAVPRLRPGWALLSLLPGALCAAAVLALRHTDGRTRLLAVAVGVLAVALALRAALRRGPLRAPDRAHAAPHRVGGWTCWLLAYAALGDGLLRSVVDGGPDGLPTGAPDGAWPLAVAPLLTLTLACAPAAFTSHLFDVRARRRLNASHGLNEFTASVRPVLLGTFALFLAALVALTGLCAAALGEPAAHPGTLTLGALLLLARLLTAHGFTRAPALALGVAGAAEAMALACVLTSRLPGCGFLAAPFDALVTAWGPAAVPALGCGTAALTLLIHAVRTLTRASAHTRTDQPC